MESFSNAAGSSVRTVNKVSKLSFFAVLVAARSVVDLDIMLRQRRAHPARTLPGALPSPCVSRDSLHGRAGWAGGRHRSPEGRGPTRTRERAFHDLHLLIFAHFFVIMSELPAQCTGAPVGCVEVLWHVDSNIL